MSVFVSVNVFCIVNWFTQNLEEVFIIEMGRKCCVPACGTNSNLSGSIFRFPSDEKRKNEWKKAIPRDDSFNTDHAGVCILHFKKKFIVTHNDRGLPMAKPRLTKDALPTIFNFTVDGIPDMFVYDPEIIKETDERNEDLIRDFQNLKTKYSSHISQIGWLTTVSEHCITFYKVKMKADKSLIVQINVTVDNDLCVKSFSENELIENSFYVDILPPHRHVTLFSQLQQILVRCDSDIKPVKQDEVLKYMRQALSNITAAIYLIENDDEFEYTNCVKFIQDQLVQLTSNRRKYATNTFLNAFTVFLQSSKTYDLIRDSKMLILPNPVHLRRISNYQDLNPNNKSSNLNYIKKVVANLQEREKYVIIQIDEIYSNPSVNFWHELTGFADNKDEVATTVLGVVVSSCFGRMKEIVNLIPLKDPTGLDLKSYGLDVIGSLQTIGKK